MVKMADEVLHRQAVVLALGCGVVQVACVNKAKKGGTDCQPSGATAQGFGSTGGRTVEENNRIVIGNFELPRNFHLIREDHHRICASQQGNYGGEVGTHHQDLTAGASR